MSNNIENNTENTKRRHKMTEKTKWIITGVLCLLAVLTVIIVQIIQSFGMRLAHKLDRRIKH